MAYIDTERDSFPTFHQKELNDYMKGWNACLKSVLQQAPTADVIEVVKCGKCKHSEKYVIDNITSLYKCYKLGISGFIEDFHCGYGERSDT